MQNVLVCPQPMVIRPNGAINASNAIEFQYQLTTAVLSQRSSALLVDMGQVEAMDSAGLMALVSSLSLAQRLNRRFSLCSVPPAIRIMLEITQLDRVFEVFDSHASFEAAAA
jgi:anti-sigma B factor antagonist